MNITLSKVKRKLEMDFGWSNLNDESHNLIKDTIKVIDNELRTHKGIKIKKK